MRKNKTRYALLGWLNRGPRSGYELKKLTEDHLNFFWNESYGQIYPILHSMEKEGLVVVQDRKDPGRPPKKIYTITRSGKKELNRWFEFEPDKEIYRSEMLLKLFFSDSSSITSLRYHIQERLAQARTRLREFDQKLEAVAREKHGKQELAYWTMTIELGISQELAMIDWCVQTLDNLESLDSTVE